jgi:hypothetical protein
MISALYITSTDRRAPGEKVLKPSHRRVRRQPGSFVVMRGVKTGFRRSVTLPLRKTADRELSSIKLFETPVFAFETTKPTEEVTVTHSS